MSLERRVSEYIKFGSIDGVEPKITAAFEIECNRQINRGVKFPIRLFDSKGKCIYFEDSSGDWCKCEFDSNSNETYFEDSDDYWCKCEFDENGNKIYFEDSDDYWFKREFDSNNNETYFEDSYGEITGTKRQQGVTQ